MFLKIIVQFSVDIPLPQHGHNTTSSKVSTNLIYFLEVRGHSSKIGIALGGLFVLRPASIEEQITFSFSSLRAVSSIDHYTMVSKVDGSFLEYFPPK